MLKNDLIKGSEKPEEGFVNTPNTSLFGNRVSPTTEALQKNRFNGLLELQRKIKEDLEKSKAELNSKSEEENKLLNTVKNIENPLENKASNVEETKQDIKVEENEAPKDITPEEPKIKIEQLEEASKEIDKQIENIANENIKDTPKTSFDEMYFKIFGTKPPKPEGDEDSNKDENVIEDSAHLLKPNEVENTNLFDNIEDDYKYKPQYKFVGIVFNTYIIFEMDNEMYIMDQHAAHERIMFEKVKKNYYSDEAKDSQLMLLPDIITLTHKEMDIAKENMDLFRKAGFIIDEFGENTIKISGTPSICVDLNTRELFLETLDEINAVARTAKQEKENRFLATIACKSAVKAHMVLTKEEVESLMDELLKLTNPFTCPHGRPTVIKMSKYEIERKFERK